MATFTLWLLTSVYGLPLAEHLTVVECAVQAVELSAEWKKVRPPFRYKLVCMESGAGGLSGPTNVVPAPRPRPSM